MIGYIKKVFVIQCGEVGIDSVRTENRRLLRAGGTDFFEMLIRTGT